MSVRFDRFGDIIVYQHHEYSIAKHGVETEKKIIISSHNTSNTVKKTQKLKNKATKNAIK